MVSLGSTMMVMPPKGWTPEGFTPPEAAGAGGESFTPREMLRTPQFHLISLTFMVSAGAGLMAIGLMKLYPIEALGENGISESEAERDLRYCHGGLLQHRERRRTPRLGHPQ